MCSQPSVCIPLSPQAFVLRFHVVCFDQDGSERRTSVLHGAPIAAVHGGLAGGAVQLLEVDPYTSALTDLSGRPRLKHNGMDV